MHELKINKNDSGQRLDKFITKTLDLPMSLLYKSIRLKKIKVNRKRAEASQILLEGDTVQCFLADSFFEKKSDESDSLSKIAPKLMIVYEDDNIMLLNKRPGVSVHEDEHGAANTLITHILAYLYQKGEYNPSDEQSFTPALCNRIDRNTGGIVIAAKNAEALRVMNDKIKEREIDKFYIAAIHGIPEKSQDTLTGYLLKDEKNNIVRVYDKNPPRGAKNIITKYKVLSEKREESLIEVELVTGRTHQIRAHMAHIGHPLLGDGKYGVNKDDRAKGYKFQALYSYRLIFDFGEDEGYLGYLSGKQVNLESGDVWFVSEFSGADEKIGKIIAANK